MVSHIVRDIYLACKSAQSTRMGVLGIIHTSSIETCLKYSLSTFFLTGGIGLYILEWGIEQMDAEHHARVKKVLDAQ